MHRAMFQRNHFRFAARASNSRSARPRFSAILLLLIACESKRHAPEVEPLRPRGTQSSRRKEPLVLADASVHESSHWSPRAETLKEVAEAGAVVRRVSPQSAPPQRIAFFARNLALVAGDGVWATPVGADEHRNPCRPNRLDIEGPREIAALADQTLLVLAATRTLVLESNCRTIKPLPRVSYLPGNRLLTDPRWSRAFTLLDASTGHLQLFRWGEETKDAASVFIPVKSIDDPHLRAGICASMRDASIACSQESVLFAGWPGYPTHRLGSLEPGAAVVRLLWTNRADQTHVLRENGVLEEYRLSAPPRKLGAFTLPRVPFDVSVGSGFISVLQVEDDNPNSTRFRLVVLESDGTWRWSILLEEVPAYVDERQWHRQYFGCRQLAAHPTRPWIAVSNCEQLRLYDARNGQLLQQVDRGAS